MSHRKILVTGGSGFVGTNLITSLQDDEFIFFNLDREKAHQKSKAGTIVADIHELDENFFKKLDFEYVIHLAALSNPAECEKNPELAYKENVELTRKLLEIMSKRDIKKFIFASSYLVCKGGGVVDEDSPLDEKVGVYGKTKIEAEKLCKEYIKKGMPVVIARFGNIYGPFQKPIYLIPQIITDAIKTKKISVRNEKPIRDFIYISDVIDALGKILDSKYTGTLNLTSGRGCSVAELTKIIARISGINGGEIEYQSQGGYEEIIGDNTKAKKGIGWQPRVSLEEGIQNTYDFYLKLHNDGI